CPSPSVHVKPCDPITCLQQTTTTRWAIEAKDKKCHRLHPIIEMRPCCCRREAVKNNILKKCIPTNGRIEVINRMYHFNAERRICEFKDVKKHIDLSCPTETNIIKGVCNLANGIALDTVTSWDKITSQCNCVQKTKYRKRICFCPSDKNVDVKCDPVTCNQTTTIRWFNKVGCQCVKKEEYIQSKCCCPKPVEHLECQRGGSLLLIKKISYNLDEEKGQCISQTDLLRKDVVCGVHGPRFLKRVCDRKTCHLVTVLLKTVLRNCQCHRMIKKIVHRDIRCCCSNPRFQEKCHEDYGIISRVTYRYELFRKQCITRKFVDQNKVVCPEEKVTRGHCDVNTKLRSVQRRFYLVANCKCQLKIENKVEPCTCPLPLLLKENCTNGKTSRRVWRISYALRKNDESGKVACEQEKEYLFEEPCHCKSPKVVRKCQAGDIIYIKEAEYLVNRNDRVFCAVRHYMKKVPVTCRINAVRIKEEPCINEVKRVTFMQETLDKQTCECKNQVKVEHEKCDCGRNNHTTESCQNGVRVINKEIHVFSQALRRCVKSNVRSVHPVDTVNLAIYKNTFIHIGGQCLPDQEVITTETRCQEKAQIIEKSTCEKQLINKINTNTPNCFETLKISVPTVVDCKCQMKIVQVQRRCCTSEPKVKQICDPVKGRWVKMIENYVLSPGSVLFKRDDLVVYDQIEKVTSEQRDQTVVCPQPVSYENCDKKTGLLTRVNTHYKQVGCECRPVKQVTRGKCGCPPTRRWISECKQNFRYQRTITFKFVNGTCVRQEKIGKQRCGCPQPINRIYCDGCDHLNRKVYQCRDNIIPTVGYWKYELVKGDCIPKRMKYSKRLSK
ncbi:unnamed protein product, partial [Trichobilharzia regenti]